MRSAAGPGTPGAGGGGGRPARSAAKPPRPSPCRGRARGGPERVSSTGARPQQRRLQRGGLGGDALALMPDAEAAIQVLADLDAAAGQVPWPRGGSSCTPMLAEAHRVIAAHGADVAQSSRSARGRCRAARGRQAGSATAARHGEAGVEAGQIGRQDGIGLLQGGGPGQAQLGHQPILERAEEPLDPPLGLRRVGGDARRCPTRASARPTWVGSRSPASCSARLSRSCGGADEDAVPVVVDRLRDARRSSPPDAAAPGSPPHPPARERPPPAPCRWHRRWPPPGAARPALLQPGMGAGIELEQHPGLGLALPPPAMGRRTAAGAGAPARPSRRSRRTGGARATMPSSLGQHLAQVGVVEPGIRRPGQRDHPLPPAPRPGHELACVPDCRGPGRRRPPFDTPPTSAAPAAPTAPGRSRPRRRSGRPPAPGSTPPVAVVPFRSSSLSPT